ncbi:MAG: hypothetical protein LBB28_03790 [Synergistaceae bacterium]|nr:hypothetical protein [Synergistaceae bacterium]
MNKLLRRPLLEGGFDAEEMWIEWIEVYRCGIARHSGVMAHENGDT